MDSLNNSLADARRHALERRYRASFDDTRFRALIENDIAAISLLDSKLRFVYTSRSSERVIGYSPDEIVGQRAMSPIVLHQDRAALRATFKRILASPNETVALNFRVRDKSGNIRWIEGTARNLLDDKAVQAIVCNCHDASEGVAAAEALHETEERFRTTFELAPVGICHKSLEGEYLDVNRRMCEMLGYSRNELIGKSVDDITYPEDRSIGSLENEKLLRGEIDAFSVEKRYVRKDGGIVWAHVTISVRCNSKGEPIYHIGVIEDITARKRAEERQRRVISATRCIIWEADVLEGDPDPVWKLRFPHGGSVREFLRTDKFSEAELSHMWEQCLHPDDRKRMHQTYLKALRAGKHGYSQEFRCTRLDGDIRWMYEQTSIERVGDNRWNFVGVVVDITERKRAEEEARESLELHNQVVSSIREGIVVLDKSLRYIGWNPFEEELTGVKAEQVLGKTVPELYPQADKVGLNELHRRALAGESVDLPPVKFPYPDSDLPRWVTAHYNPLRNAAGEIIGVIGVIRDVTEQKEAEQMEKRLAQVVAATPCIVWEADVSDRNMPVWSERALNEATARELFPVDCVEELGFMRAWYMSQVDEDRERMDREANEAIQRDRNRFSGEYRYRSSLGDIRWVYEDGTIEQTGDDRWHVSGITLDITDRRRAEQAVRDSRELLRQVISSVDEGIAVFDLEMKYIGWNPYLETMTGKKAEDVLGKPFFEVNPDGDPRFSWVFAKAAAGETIRVPVYEFRPAGMDRVYWLSLAFYPLRDADGNVSGVIEVLRDVSEQRQAEKALQESNARFQTLVNANIIPVLIGKVDGQVSYANEAFLEMVGYSSEDLAGGRVSWKVMASPELMPKYEAARRELEERRACAPFEMELIRTDGERVPVMVGIAVLDGLPDSFVAYYVNLTEMKRAERELQQRNDQLKELSGRLLDAQEQERRQLARDLHDEVGQTLTGLKLMLDMISKNTGDAEAARYASGHVATLMQQVRSMSLDLRPHMLDELGLPPALLWLCQQFKERTGIEVRMSQNMQSCRLAPAVENAAFRIIQEALTNIARYAEVKSADVSVQLQGDRLALRISDSGRGFDLNSKLSAGGTLGLSGMRERASLLGGEFHIHTAPGAGTTVEAAIPLER